MKQIVVIALLVSCCLADYSEKQKEAMKESCQYCKKELDIPEDSDIPKKIKYGNLTEKDEPTKKFIVCFMKNLNFVDAEGVVKETHVIDFLADNYDRKQATDVVGGCAKPEGETVEEKTLQFYDCFFQKKSFEI